MRPEQILLSVGLVSAGVLPGSISSQKARREANPGLGSRWNNLIPIPVSGWEQWQTKLSKWDLSDGRNDLRLQAAEAEAAGGAPVKLKPGEGKLAAEARVGAENSYKKWKEQEAERRVMLEKEAKEKKEEEGDAKNEKAKRQIQNWNDFSQGVTDLDACVVLRSLEWLAYSLIEPTEDISAESGTHVFVDPELQGGPLVLDMRAMMIWEAILDRFKAQLQATNVWSRQAQLRVAECYIGASQQAGNFLTSLRGQAKDFADTSAARCLMYDKIEALYMAYDDVATLIYGGNTGAPAYVQALITANFPAQIPDDFDTPYARPAPGSAIATYLATFDTPLPSSRRFLFAQNQASWQCRDYDGAPYVFIQPAALAAGRTAVQAAPKGVGRKQSELSAKAGNLSGKAGEKIEALGRKLGVDIDK